MKRLKYPIRVRNLEQIQFRDHWYDRGFTWEIIAISDKKWDGTYDLFIRCAGLEDGWYPQELFDFIPYFEEKVC